MCCTGVCVCCTGVCVLCEGCLYVVQVCMCVVQVCVSCTGVCGSCERLSGHVEWWWCIGVVGTGTTSRESDTVSRASFLTPASGLLIVSKEVSDPVR